MQDRHFDREKYFREQGNVTEKYIIPFIKDEIPISPGLSIAEIGCGEAGNLRPFLDMGCKLTGIDLSANKIENARKFYSNHNLRENLILVADDIFNLRPDQTGRFDLILMRDTVEHIPDLEKLLDHLSKFLKSTGRIFIGFPPWRMPFGGHQQMCESVLCKIPYFHLLPVKIYVWIMKIFGETPSKINGLLQVRETRLSIARFNKIVKENNYKVDKVKYYLINPSYQVKFNLKPRMLPWIFNIPYLRDFITSTCYYIISKNNLNVTASRGTEHNGLPDFG
jgi:SAM-dependent methyltransferase